MWTFIFFQCGRKRKKKCQNNKKEIYNDILSHKRQIIQSSRDRDRMVIGLISTDVNSAL